MITVELQGDTDEVVKTELHLFSEFFSTMQPDGIGPHPFEEAYLRSYILWKLRGSPSLFESDEGDSGSPPSP